MFSQRFLIPLLFLTLSLLTVISAVKCPDTTNIQSSDLEEHLVFLKTSKTSVCSDHKDLLTKCLGRRVEKFNSGQGIFNSDCNKSPDKNLITDLSFDGTFSVYSGFFDKAFVKNFLAKRDDVEFAEPTIKVNANYAIFNRTDRLEKRTIQSNAPYNLDRIDQKDFPLDGKYNYPNNAGSGVNIYVIDSHGTNVAGIIGGKNFGVSKKSKLIAVKVLDQNGQGSSVTVVAGLSFVLLQHSASSNKNTVINLSLGGAFSQSINQMVSFCSNAGIHVVVSAGDGSTDACNTSPASAPQAITVGATEKTSNDMASFSNFGTCVKIFAPGRDIVAAGALLSNSLSKASGTSQSCPHVTGAVALIISKQGNMSPSSMLNTLMTLSTKNILQNAKPNIFLRVPSP
ncbi:peptidase S8/S53 domain-containing protein [Glomus cerebriforme]|uniref:Peptidase S8/S53 domain-containing protein n=1 Tax=Glomus cerebriforme TaxID=658196 RepID=A0A397SD60_9GLOM|nr:peptidase S8/S53 domain-containing protein [Glomus cerebriforme]